MNEEGDTSWVSRIIRFHWLSILITTLAPIAYFIFKFDIDEIILVCPQLSLSFIVFAILLMFNLIKLECEIKSKSEEIENLKRQLKDVTARSMHQSEELNTELVATESKENLDALEATEFTIRAKFSHISMVTYDPVYSQQTESAGVTRKLGMRNPGCFSINFWLYGENKNAVDWCCPAIVEFRLISQKSGEIVKMTSIKTIHNDNRRSSYIGDFSHDELFDEKKGFVKDDCFIVNLLIKSFPRSIHEARKMVICANFTEISKLANTHFASYQPTEIDGIIWDLNVYKDYDSCISFYLNAENKNAVEWQCPVLVDFRLISHKSEKLALKFREPVFYDETKRAERIAFSSCEELFDKGNGYVKDDSIIIELVIRFFPID